MRIMKDNIKYLIGILFIGGFIYYVGIIRPPIIEKDDYMKVVGYSVTEHCDEAFDNELFDDNVGMFTPKSVNDYIETKKKLIELKTVALFHAKRLKHSENIVLSQKNIERVDIAIKMCDANIEKLKYAESLDKYFLDNPNESISVLWHNIKQKDKAITALEDEYYNI